MSTLMLSQQVGVEGGVPPDEKGRSLGGASFADGEPPKVPERKGAEVCECPSNCSADAIAERATTITPLLAEILTHKATPTLRNVE